MHACMNVHVRCMRVTALIDSELDLLDLGLDVFKLKFSPVRRLKVDADAHEGGLDRLL